jgi:hypothetical protein
MVVAVRPLGLASSAWPPRKPGLIGCWGPQTAKNQRARASFCRENFARGSYLCIYVIRERGGPGCKRQLFAWSKRGLLCGGTDSNLLMPGCHPASQPLFLPILGKSNLFLTWPRPHGPSRCRMASWSGLMAWPHGRSRVASASCTGFSHGHRTVLAHSDGGIGDKLWPHSLASSARLLRDPN